MKSKAETKTLRDRMLDAEVRCSNWLAEANQSRERGNLIAAEKKYDKAQIWLDKANALRDRLLYGE